MFGPLGWEHWDPLDDEEDEDIGDLLGCGPRVLRLEGLVALSDGVYVLRM